MAETRTISRPYAQAVFQLAREHNALARWSEMLELGTQIVTDPSLRDLMGSPRVNRQQIIEIMLGAAGDRLDEQGANFIRLLAENERLTLLPEISDQFETYRREAEKTVEAEVITAFPLTEGQQRQISAALEARLGQAVSLTESVDESLLGGMIVRVGDRVIDGSVMNQIDKLSQNLAR